MKITRALKRKIQVLTLQMVIGQVDDLSTFADILEEIATEARKQNESPV